MIVSVSPEAKGFAFQMLMKRCDNVLNVDAEKRRTYYSKRNGIELEDDVLNALRIAAKGTEFENTIVKISGKKFPDIIAMNYYGVEVKSTKEDMWTSTGSSILESTRVQGIERIYMTFGKLGGDPIEFLSRPYEECISDIAVTHMPRYRINMKLKNGETIFDKLGIKYDVLRKLDNPVIPVAKYYRSLLKPGESLWWADDYGDESVSAKIRLWRNVPTVEKRFFTSYACVNFPEVFCRKYEKYVLWLASQGIVDPHIRDQFSAGGRERIELPGGDVVELPAIYRRVRECSADILTLLQKKIKENIYKSQGNFRDCVLKWCKDVSTKSRDVPFDVSMRVLEYLLLNNVDSLLVQRNGYKIAADRKGEYRI